MVREPSRARRTGRVHEASAESPYRRGLIRGQLVTAPRAPPGAVGRIFLYMTVFVGHTYLTRRREPDCATPPRGLAYWRDIAAAVHKRKNLPKGRCFSSCGPYRIRTGHPHIANVV